VEVQAFPAVELLLGRADDVKVEIDRGESGTGRLGDLVARTGKTDRLDARVGELTTHGLRLRDVVLRKRDDVLRGEATVLEDDLEAALPDEVTIKPPAEGSDGFALEGRVKALGVNVRARVNVTTRQGAIVLEPSSARLATFLSFSVFDDDRVPVDAIEARRARGGFLFSADAHLSG
jgi:hypothetical protein